MQIFLKKLELDMDDIYNKYLNEGLSALSIAKIYNCSEMTILKRLKNSGRKDVLDKIKDNKNQKIEGACEVCGRKVRLKRWKKKTVLCEAHYKQMKNHGEITNKNIKEEEEIYIYDDYAEIVIKDILGEEVARTLISLDKLDTIKGYFLHMKGGGYVGVSKDGKSTFLHRLIIGAGKGEVVDHINRNKLDNRNENLRICTQLENLLNKGMQKNNTSGVKGVFFDKNKQKWTVSIGFKGKNIHIGMFDDFENAVKARKKAEKKYFGDLLL